MQLLRVCACAFAAEGLGVRMFVYDIVAVAAQAGARDLHHSRSAAIESHFMLARHACITHPHNFIAPPVSQCTQQAAAALSKQPAGFIQVVPDAYSVDALKKMHGAQTLGQVRQPLQCLCGRHHNTHPSSQHSHGLVFCVSLSRANPPPRPHPPGFCRPFCRRQRCARGVRGEHGGLQLLLLGVEYKGQA